MKETPTQSSQQTANLGNNGTELQPCDTTTQPEQTRTQGRHNVILRVGLIVVT